MVALERSMGKAKRVRSTPVCMRAGLRGVYGIHTYNGANLDSIYSMNVGEDAMTIESGTTTMSNGEGYDTDEEFFQVNAASTLTVINCITIARAAIG